MEKIRDKTLFGMEKTENEKMTGWLRDVKMVKEKDLAIYLEGWCCGWATLQARLRELGYVDPRTDETIEKERKHG